MKIKIANRIAPDGTPRFAGSHLGLFCLPMSHKKDARLILVNLGHNMYYYICNINVTRGQSDNIYIFLIRNLSMIHQVWEDN